MTNKFSIHEDKAFVSMDGDYGQGIVVFDPAALTDMQWERVADMHESDRSVYIVAVLQNDTTVIKDMEEDLDEV